MTDVPYGERIVTSLIPVPQFSSRTDPWKTTLASSKSTLAERNKRRIPGTQFLMAYQNRFICLIAHPRQLELMFRLTPLLRVKTVVFLARGV